MLDDLGIRVDVRNRVAGRAVLLLGGLSAGLGKWEPFREELHDRTTIVYDPPGVGGTPVPRFPLSIASLARVACAALDHAGLVSADVVGFSYGGAVAQQLAIDAPHRVRSLVLAATSCGVGSVPASLLSMAREVLVAPLDRTINPFGFLWQVAAYSNWTSVGHLGCIRHRTLVVAGRRDAIVPVANARLLARRIPGARLIELDADHDLFSADLAPVTASHVVRFLDAAREMELSSGT
jgi:pimeloyl-ACP methyl ester carboxylesterase